MKSLDVEKRATTTSKSPNVTIAISCGNTKQNNYKNLYLGNAVEILIYNDWKSPPKL